jgi:hypothetical protein
MWRKQQGDNVGRSQRRNEKFMGKWCLNKKTWKFMFSVRAAMFKKRYAQMKMELHPKVKIKN